MDFAEVAEIAAIAKAACVRHDRPCARRSGSHRTTSGGERCAVCLCGLLHFLLPKRDVANATNKPVFSAYLCARPVCAAAEPAAISRRVETSADGDSARPLVRRCDKVALVIVLPSIFQFVVAPAIDHASRRESGAAGRARSRIAEPQLPGRVRVAVERKDAPGASACRASSKSMSCRCQLPSSSMATRRFAAVFEHAIPVGETPGTAVEDAAARMAEHRDT